MLCPVSCWSMGTLLCVLDTGWSLFNNIRNSSMYSVEYLSLYFVLSVLMSLVFDDA